MMKQLSCRDMGADDDFVAMGETSEEVKNQMMEHVRMEHSDMMENMSRQEKDEMMKKMDEMMSEA